jgi:hypothetical protein
MASGHRPGGGLHSKQTVHKQAPKIEPRPHSINPKAVAEIGASQYWGQQELRDGKGYATPVGISDPVAAVGVGGGRTIYKSGSQQGLRPARELPAGRDMLSEFGAESLTSKERTSRGD